MPTSQNGYSAPITPVSREIPGGRVSLRAGPTGDLLAWVARQFHARVQTLVWPGNWGYAYREIRGSTGLSNHASGTALDLNAPEHPLGSNPSANYTPAEIAAIRAIVAETRGCVRWGGDYTGRKDGMHFEINDGVSEARCAAVLVALNTPTKPPTTSTEVEIMERRTITPPNAGQNEVRLFLSGSPGAAIVVRPRIDPGGTAKPMWVGDIFAWGSNNVGIGHNPKKDAPGTEKLITHRRYDLPGAVWVDFHYSASEPFEVDIVG